MHAILQCLFWTNISEFDIVFIELIIQCLSWITLYHYYWKVSKNDSDIVFLDYQNRCHDNSDQLLVCATALWWNYDEVVFIVYYSCCTFSPFDSSSSFLYLFSVMLSFSPFFSGTYQFLHPSVLNMTKRWVVK